MAAEPLPSQPPGFATLAKRIATWTTNGLLTLLILVAGLGFGRQVLKWWAADATPPGSPTIASPYDGLGDPMQLHTIQFGDSSWSLHRQSIVGDKQIAIERLRSACREVLTATSLPPSDEWLPEAKISRDDNFLTLLSKSTPVEQEPGKWRLYEFHEAFPMAAGLTGQAPTADDQPVDAPPNLAQSGCHVVVWGVAMPAGNEAWTLCTFQAESPSDGEGSNLADIPVPPESRRGLSLRVVGGGAMIAFSGPDRPEEWKRFYDNWFRRSAWSPVTGWQPAGAAWYAKFAANSGRGSVDIRFGPDGRGGLSGLLMITPP